MAAPVHVWYGRDVGERCSRHPGARAGWACGSCGARLCPGCAFVHRAQTSEAPACGRCGGLAEPIRLHRSVLRPFAARVAGALGWPLSRSGLLALAGLAAVLWLLRAFGPLGAFFAFGVWWAFLFGVIRRSAYGDHELGPPDFSDFHEDLLLPAVRGAVATALVWLPGALYAGSRLAGGEADPAALARDPVLWLVALAGIAYGPAAVMVAAAGGGFLRLLNPAVAIGVVVRLGTDYWIAASAVVALLVLDAVAGLGAGLVAATGVPVLSGWLGAAIGTYFPVVAARVLGLLLYVRGDAVGLGDEAQYLEPVLGDAAPRGSAPVLATTLADPAPEDPPGARAEVAAAATAPARAPATAARIAAVAAAATQGAQAIVDALGTSDLAGAAALFATYRGPTEALPPRGLYEMARAAAQGGQHAVAARALHAAGTSADAVVAPHALLALARVYERRLGRAEDARKVLLHLVARWPDSEPARLAHAALAPTGSSP
jgi:hypothetical protein